MEIVEKKLEPISKSNCRVGRISSLRPVEEDKQTTEIGYKKVDLETSHETRSTEIV